ncbi:hypothetical protein LJC32_07010, partial [Oscillospiraceae bacterium OttesenSCG-928-F05]|nr:hypothetical protein [Oscillospiraceae bacterium OttesenSCG-928-F05]
LGGTLVGFCVNLAVFLSFPISDCAADPPFRPENARYGGRAEKNHKMAIRQGREKKFFSTAEGLKKR